MRIVAAFDSFKGSLSSVEAGRAAASGVGAVLPESQIDVVAIADGGEGLLEAVLAVGAARLVRTETLDALGRPLVAEHVVLADGSVVVEAARTVGLGLVGPVDQTVPWASSSYGLGVQLATALDAGSSDVMVGLGGTATTDGGTGMLAALGATLLDGDGRPLPPHPNPLVRVAGVGPLPDLSCVQVLTDVSSPLLGETGAARLFGPQKGAGPDDVERLETLMRQWAQVLVSASGRSEAEVVDTPGSGAAGGLGAALLACGARLVPGFATVARLIGLGPRIEGADLVLTGEGSLDGQTALGKGPAGVAGLARAYGVPVVALAGRVVHPVGDGFDAAFSIHPVAPVDPLDPAVSRAGLGATAGEVVRLVDRLTGR